MLFKDGEAKTQMWLRAFWVILTCAALLGENPGLECGYWGQSRGKSGMVVVNVPKQKLTRQILASCFKTFSVYIKSD